jgi:putative transposase
MERKSNYRKQGVDLDTLSSIVGHVLGISESDFEMRGNQPQRVRARSLFCYWAVRELGIATTILGHRFGLTQPAISVAVSRGEKLVTDKGWRLDDFIEGDDALGAG